VIEQPTSDRRIELGSLDRRHLPQVESLRQVLEGADIPIVVATDIQASLWEKLIYISAFSGLSTLTRLAVADLLAHQPTRALYRSIMQETAAVARAARIRVARDIVERTMHYLDTSGDPGESSMAVDFHHQRRIEVEAIHGAVVRHGQRLQVDTPINAAIYAALVVMDQYNRQMLPGRS
jgi:2-dehydropantoate 2-reductase